MKVIINADDYGRSKGITDNISECYDKGSLNSVSIPVIGNSPEYSIKELKTRPNIRTALHLDLIEGKPLTSPTDIPDIIDKNGRFYLSFPKLWLKYAFSGNKDAIKSQIKLEIKSQIDKYIELIGKEKALNIDSHQHIHLVPFVFDALIELASDYKFNYIRIIKEPFFISINGESSIRSYLGPNLLKHFILNYVCGKYAGILRELSIRYPDYFIGTLFTGYMTLGSVEKALKKVVNTRLSLRGMERRGNLDCFADPPYSRAGARNDNITVEILLHACKAVPGEEHFWNHIPGLKRYYYSKFRDQEKEILLSKDFKELIDQLSSSRA